MIILDRDGEPVVEVFEVPVPAEVGTEFLFNGRAWRVVGRRPRSRVLLATEIRSEVSCRPIQN